MTRATPSRSARDTGGLRDAWFRRQSVGGVPFVPVSPDAAADAVSRAAVRIRRNAAGPGEHVHLTSAHGVGLAAQDPAFDAVLNGDGWNLPDGKPVTLVSRLRGDRPSLQQTRGVRVFLETCDIGRSHGIKHYLLGSTPATLRLMEERLTAGYPGIEIVAADSPPFRTPTPEELQERDRRIADSGAHIVWVGLGTPKQDYEAARIAAGLPVVAVAVGAAFDFAAGTLRVAPPWVSAIGLEWFFRLASEPRRLWRRYAVYNARFLVAVLRNGRRRRVRSR